ncbi:MAG: hypothetical protein LAC70_06340 [Methylovulum sp.]|nr:hypothetical protein [Methylovulum sp.]
MIIAAFDFALWTILFFIVGMFKPHWPLFFLKAPSRFLIVAISTVFVMITLTLWGEGHRQASEENAKKTAPAVTTSAPIPVPVPKDVAPTPLSAAPVTTPPTVEKAVTTPANN